MPLDTLVSSGPNYWELQTPAAQLLVTPVGGVQTMLGGWMAAPVIVGLFTESAVDVLTANPGGGKAGALQLGKELNRVAVVATIGDSVVLPASAAGLTIFVENGASNAMQVYGLGTDTINAVATGTGVSQMGGSLVVYTCYSAGAWFANGLGAGYSGSFSTSSIKTGITAQPGGGQPAAGSAYILSAMLNNISVCATAGNSVGMPPSSPGMSLTVVNNGAASCSVFSDIGSTMNGTLNGSIAVAVGTVMILYCFVTGAWVSK